MNAIDTGARRPVVGVMGSGSEAHAEQSRQLGRWIAERGWHLLTGGGQGVMAAVTEAFCEMPGRSGLAIGVLPAGRAPGLYPNRWVEIPIRTHLAGGDGPASASSRNAINVLSSDVIVALPGGSGTRAELELARRYERPAIAWWPTSATAPPEGIPVARDFADVCQFVESALGSESR